MLKPCRLTVLLTQKIHYALPRMASSQEPTNVERKPKKPQKKAADCNGISDEDFTLSEYFFENGLRKVYPYLHTWKTFCKGRWLGKSLLEVYEKEFSRSAMHVDLKEQIAQGNIRVNGEIVTPEYKLKDNDVIENSLHRHETPITDQEIEIVFEDKNTLVVNKPSSIPIHPCGRYRFNSLVYIIAMEFGYRDVRSVHRLDRLTSGLMIFGKTLAHTQAVAEQIRDKKVEKEYVCRVAGEFPTEPVICQEPIDILSHKVGICYVSESGKACETHFERVAFNGQYSIVKCRPVTGRMHQIRVHLQFLGFPIVNDPLYNSEEVWGPNKGKGGVYDKPMKQIADDCIRLHNVENYLMDEVEPTVPPQQHLSEEPVDKKPRSDRPPFDPSKKIVHPSCYDCRHRFRDPVPDQLVMDLHAFRYKGDGWEYSVKWPEWAQKGFIGDTNKDK